MGIGFSEMVVIAVIALIFLGPEKFPDFAKLFVRAVRDLRNYVDDVKSEVAKEILPVQSELQQLSRMDPETYINKLIEDGDEKKTDTTSVSSDPYDKTGETAPPVQAEETASVTTPSEPVNDAIAHATGTDMPSPPAESSDAGAAVSAEPKDPDGLHPPERLEG